LQGAAAAADTAPVLTPPAPQQAGDACDGNAAGIAAADACVGEDIRHHQACWKMVICDYDELLRHPQEVTLTLSQPADPPTLLCHVWS